MRLLLPVLIAVHVVTSSVVMAKPQAGSVTGVVPLPLRPPGRIAVEKYTGTISGKVGSPPQACAGVWIEGPGIKAPAKPTRVVLSQQAYQFERSLIIVPLGTEVAFPNNDNDYHNVYSLSQTKRFDIGRYKKNEAPVPVESFNKAGFVNVQCEIHDHMKTSILVVDSPWCTVTDAAGKFTLTGIAPGSYTLHAQLDKDTRWSAPVMISPGKTFIADFTRTSAIP
jgi:plastocyanin